MTWLDYSADAVTRGNFDVVVDMQQLAREKWMKQAAARMKAQAAANPQKEKE